MKTVLQQLPFRLALALCVTTGFAVPSASWAAARSEAVSSEQRQLGAFKAIELAGPYHVVIRAQGTNGVELTGQAERRADVETIVNGDTLIVRPRAHNGTSFFFGFGRRHEPVTVRIGVAVLSSLKSSGSGDVEVEQISTERLSISATGPGEVRASGAVRELVLESRGSGDLDLRQLASTNVKLTMSGPGDVRLAGIGGELSAEVNGSGDLRADALRLTRLTAHLRGPGGVTLAGSSAELRVEQDGSGDLAASDLQVRSARLQMSGPGSIALAGVAELLDAQINGSGDLDAPELKVRNATVRMRGPGAVRLSSVSDTLDAEVRGSGDLHATLAGKRLLLRMSGPGDALLDGTVAQLDAQLSGSGSLDARRTLAEHANVAVRGPGSAVVNVRRKGDPRNRAQDQARLVTVERGGAHEFNE
jgi:hypothetical protein